MPRGATTTPQGKALLYYGLDADEFCAVFAALGVSTLVLGTETDAVQLDLAATPFGALCRAWRRCRREDHVRFLEATAQTNGSRGRGAARSCGILPCICPSPRPVKGALLWTTTRSGSTCNEVLDALPDDVVVALWEVLEGFQVTPPSPPFPGAAGSLGPGC